MTEEGYNKKVPPLAVSKADRTTQIIPVQLNISIALQKTVDKEEIGHNRITLETEGKL